MIQPILHIAIAALGLFCAGMILALVTVYMRRIYAWHVVPMGLSATTILVLVIYGSLTDELSTVAQCVVAAALVIKCLGLWMILSRIHAKID